MMFRIHVLVSAVALVFMPGAGSACQSGDQFRCGERIPGSGDVRVCGGTDEVCICATQSCARQLKKTDTSCREDGGGYRYLEAPFARTGLADECVADEDVASRLSASTTSTPLCEEVDDGAMDASVDTPMDASVDARDGLPLDAAGADAAEADAAGVP